MLKSLFISALFSSSLSITAAQASCHVSDCSDQDFIELGKKFPAVGCFLNCGSGTLVNFGIPELNGRTVITCAHLFKDDEDMAFTIGDEGTINGIPLPHPKFTRYFKGVRLTSKSHDIALFILERPVKSITPAEIDLETPYENFPPIRLSLNGD